MKKQRIDFKGRLDEKTVLGDGVGNHAALGPTNWGRAGRDVRLLDGAAYPSDMFRIDAPAAPGTALDKKADDPRVALIKQHDPSFDPAGKSDVYLDTRVELLKKQSDGSGAAAPGAVAAAQTTEDAVDPDPTGDKYRAETMARNIKSLYGDAQTKSPLDEALEGKAKRDAEQAKGGIPRGSLYVDKQTR